MKARRIVMIAFQVSALAAFAGSVERVAAADRFPSFPPELKIVRSVPFKQIEDKTLDMMLFLPQEKKFEKSPLVVFIHGGGFAGGDKFHVRRHDILGVLNELTVRGFTCARSPSF